MLKEVWQVLHLEQLKQLAVLKHAWRVLQVDVAHLIVLDQRDKEPESDFFRAVLEECSHDEVHALNIADGLVILRVGFEHSFKLPLSFLPQEVRIRDLEGASDVLAYLVLASRDQGVGGKFSIEEQAFLIIKWALLESLLEAEFEPSSSSLTCIRVL